MRTCTFQSVLDRVVELIGIPQASLDAAALAAVKGFINSETHNAWHHWWWPELMRSQERQYRADYNAGTAYATGAEVYYATTGKYYEATQSTTGNAPTDTDYWDELTEIDAYVALDQAGETEIGEVRGVYLEDPLVNRSARRVPWTPGPNGIHITAEQIPTSVWVWFRLRPTEYKGLADVWAAGSTYSDGQVVYYVSAASTAGYEGDWWEALAATSAGQDPEDTPAKWSKREFPEILREPVAHLAFARYMRRDDAKPEDKAEAAAEAQKQLLFAQARVRTQQGSDPYRR